MGFVSVAVRGVVPVVAVVVPMVLVGAWPALKRDHYYYYYDYYCGTTEQRI